LLGAIWGSDAEGWTAHLWQEQSLAGSALISSTLISSTFISSALVDELGSFRFAGLTPAAYEIILIAPDLTIKLAPVAVI
jgi:hypothetical protein